MKVRAFLATALALALVLSQVLGLGATGPVTTAQELPSALEEAGLRVLSAHRMPPNDAAISLGQAWVAARA